MKTRALSGVILLAAAAAGCGDFFGEARTAPTVVTIEMMAGSWSSVAVETALKNTCTKFVWNVTQTADDTASGTFTATCQTDVIVSGAATGNLSEKTLTWSATGTASAPGTPTCEVSLSGSGTFDGIQMRLPFRGTTCAGEVSGTEILRKP
jgi:hypothetical protein